MKKYFAALVSFALSFACTPEQNNPSKTDVPEGDEGKTVRVSSISLSPTAITLIEGESATITATVTPNNAENKAFTWSSSDNQIASVDSGNVTGIKAGNATITATTEDGGKTASCTVTVLQNNAPSVTIGADHISPVSAVLHGKANLGTTMASDVKIGFQYSKSAGILPSNSTTIECEDVDANYNYTSTVSGLEPNTKYYFHSFIRQNGQDTYGETKEFTTKDAATMLETLEATEIEATRARLNAKFDLTDVMCSSKYYGFFWGTSEHSLSRYVNSKEIKENAFSASLTELQHKTQYWYVAYIRLDDQTFYGDVKTFTTDIIPVESISLSKTEFTFSRLGFTLYLNATVLPNNATYKNVNWISDNEDVVIVDTYGKVTTKGYGKATIKAEAQDDSGVFASCNVTINHDLGPIPSGAVDLGLSVYWATCNVGASKPEEYGNYYAWGETEPKSEYTWINYKFRISGDNYQNVKLSKYNTQESYGAIDNKTVLDLEDDVAHVKLGGNWRMPTIDEWRELEDYCTWTWTNSYNGSGVKGRIITGPNGNSIFLPAAGCWEDANTLYVELYGNYNSSHLSTTDYSARTWGVGFGSSGFSMGGSADRSRGEPVRPVSK